MKKPGKKMVSVRLPIYIVEWLKIQSESQAVLIETALREKYNIK